MQEIIIMLSAVVVAVAVVIVILKVIVIIIKIVTITTNVFIQSRKAAILLSKRKVHFNIF